MNIALIITIAILALCAFASYKKGFVQAVFSTCSLIAALILTIWLNPIVSKNLQSNDEIMNFFKEKIQTVMNLAELEEEHKTASNAEFVEALNLPDIFVEMLDKGMGDYMEDSAVSIAELSDRIAGSIAGVIITAISFLVLFIVLDIVIHFVGKLLDWMTELPLLKQVNEIFGLLLGLVEGLLIIWVLCILLTSFAGTEFGQTVLKQINESSFLSLIYNNNLLLHFITSSVAKFL